MFEQAEVCVPMSLLNYATVQVKGRIRDATTSAFLQKQIGMVLFRDYKDLQPEIIALWTRLAMEHAFKTVTNDEIQLAQKLQADQTRYDTHSLQAAWINRWTIRDIVRAVVPCITAVTGITYLKPRWSLAVGKLVLKPAVVGTAAVSLLLWWAYKDELKRAAEIVAEAPVHMSEIGPILMCSVMDTMKGVFFYRDKVQKLFYINSPEIVVNQTTQLKNPGPVAAVPRSDIITRINVGDKTPELEGFLPDLEKDKTSFSVFLENFSMSEEGSSVASSRALETKEEQNAIVHPYTETKFETKETTYYPTIYDVDYGEQSVNGSGTTVSENVYTSYYKPPATIKLDKTKFDLTFYEKIVGQLGTRNLCFDDVSSGLALFIGAKRGSVVRFTRLLSTKPIPNEAPNGTKLDVLRTVKAENIGEFCLYGPACLSILPGVFANTSQNERISLLGRHLTPAQNFATNSQAWEKATKRGNRDFAEVLYRQCLFEPMTTAQWLLSLPKDKALSYKNFQSTSDQQRFEEAKQHYRNFFIKMETQVPPINGSLRDKAPRGIQGLASATTNIALGPFMSSVSKSLAKSFISCDGNWPRYGYTSGSTPEHVGRWYGDMLRNGYKFIEDDFSSYDATQSSGSYEFETRFYELFNMPPTARNALKNQATTTGFGNFHKYKVKYTRKSGDQNTSIGNTVCNFAAHDHALAMLGITDYYMIGLGDDNLIAYKSGMKSEEIVVRMEGAIKALGLEPKILLSTFPTYCSCEFVPVEHPLTEWALIPIVSRRVCKIGFTDAVLPTAVDPLARLKGNELSNTLNSCMPVSRVFYHFYTSMTVKGKTGGWQYRPHALSSGETRPSPAVYRWFQEAYGLDKRDLDSLEQYLWSHLESTGGLASVWNHHLFTKMMVHRGL